MEVFMVAIVFTPIVWIVYDFARFCWETRDRVLPHQVGMFCECDECMEDE